MNALTRRALRNIPAPKGRETAASLGGENAVQGFTGNSSRRPW